MSNEISRQYLKGSDLAKREQEVLAGAAGKLNFEPQELLERSAWWNSKEIGAFSYLGTVDGEKRVLKIQGIKPAVSEAEMIRNFERMNRSKVIRPPHLYGHLPWNKEKRYEALLLERIEGEKIVNTPATKDQIDEFFQMIAEYRKNCLNSPWLPKPKKSIAQQVKENFSDWHKIRHKLYEDHPLIDEDDEELIDRTVEVLTKEYEGVEPQFTHAHLSERDPVKVGEEIVIFSNLFWSWRAPYYDTIFGYHWFMYHLASVEGITQEEVEEQRKMWLKQIYSLAETQEELRLLHLALLERAAAGLNLDGLSTNPEKPIAKYLLETTRNNINELIEKLIT